MISPILFMVLFAWLDSLRRAIRMRRAGTVQPLPSNPVLQRLEMVREL